MTAAANVLSSRSSFVLAALVASWVAVVLLALVAANLHFRLVRLERPQPAVAAPARTPFQQLLGGDLVELLGSEAFRGIRVALVLSANCASCDRLLDWVRHSGSGVPIALLWRDGTPSPSPSLPPGAVVVQDGEQLSDALGVRVTPFALAADESGRVVRAQPVGAVDAFAALLLDLDYSVTQDDAAGVAPPPSMASTRTRLEGVSS